MLQELIRIPGVQIEPDDFWEWKEFQGFAQDIYGYTLYEDTPQEEFIEPSFSWFGTIVAKRRGSADGTGYFYIRCRVSGKEGEPLDLRIAESSLLSGLISLDTYAKCDCVVGSPCKRHGGGLNAGAHN